MKLLCAFIPLILIAAASSIFAQEVGYEGLNLGMTVSQIQALVDSTEWDCRYRSATLASMTYGFMFLTCPSGICTDDLDCFQPNHVVVDLYQSKIWQIRIVSDEFGDSTGIDTVSRFYQAAYSTLENRFGPPGTVVFAPSLFAEEHERIICAGSNHQTTLAEWTLAPIYDPASLAMPGKPRGNIMREVRIRYIHLGAPLNSTNFTIYIIDKTMMESRNKMVSK